MNGEYRQQQLLVTLGLETTHPKQKVRRGPRLVSKATRLRRLKDVERNPVQRELLAAAANSAAYKAKKSLIGRRCEPKAFARQLCRQDALVSRLTFPMFASEPSENGGTNDRPGTRRHRRRRGRPCLVELTCAPELLTQAVAP